MLQLITVHRQLPKLAGAEGFEPPSSVLETDSLAIELTPLFPGVRVQVSAVSLFVLPLATEDYPVRLKLIPDP